MSISVRLIDSASGREAKIRSDGSLTTSDNQSSVAYNAKFDVDDVAVEIVPAVHDKIFCITGIILTGNKNIATGTDAVVDIYTSTASASTAVVTTILTIPVARSSQAVMLGLLLSADRAHFINGKTSDEDVLVTIFGFYID